MTDNCENSSSAGAPGALEFGHHVGELAEEVMRVVGTRGSFRVILHGEQRDIFVAHALVGVIVEIEVRDFDFAGRQ